MKEVWIPKGQETQSYEEKRSTNHPILEKASEMLRTARQKSVIMAAGLVAVGLAACGNDEQQPTPTLAPTSAVSQRQERMPSATIKPTEIPISTSTETPTPKPKVISIGGSVETDPANPSVETIKLLFPEGIVHGKSPLIPKGDTLSVSLKLKSDMRINQLSLSLSDLLSIQNNKFSMGMSVANDRDTADIASAISIFQRMAKLNISDADQEIIKKITLSTVRHSNKDLVVNLSLPNESFTYIDKDGSHLVNPAERFASGKVGIGINRRGKPALAVENIMIANSKGKLVAMANRFDIAPQPTRTIPTETPIPPPTSTPTPEPTPKPTEKPTPTPTPTLAPTPSPSSAPAEKPKTYVKPGQELNWVQRIENKFHEPKKRSIDLEFQGGDEGNLKIEIRVLKTSEEIKRETEIAREKAIEEGKDPDKIVIETEKSISEGAVFNVLPGGTTVRIIVDVPPGASPTCFDSIKYKLHSEEEGRGNEPLARVSLNRNICIEETLLVFFAYHHYDEKQQLVTSPLVFYNLAGIEQKTRFWVDIDKCSFPIAEREFRSDSKKISPDEPVVIPANRIVRYVMLSTPPADKKPSSPYCLVRFERILGK